MNNYMKFLITGGAGFIGSHIVERLLNEGNSVRVLDNFSSGKEENIKSALRNKNFDLIRGDIRDYDVCVSATKDIQYVLHQAALRSVSKSMDDPYSYNDVNIKGTLNLLKASSANKVKRFVFASSSSVYGDTDTFPEREDHLPLLISPYALTKLAGEYYCRIFSKVYKLPTICLRYFNVFGPRQSLDDEYAVVIPKFIDCMIHDQQPPIFGNGKQSRDFTFITNVVEANIRSTQAHEVFHGIFNIANNKEHSILQLVEILNKILNKSIKPQFLPLRVGDVFKSLADISKAKNELGFTPSIDFEEGLQRTVESRK